MSSFQRMVVVPHEEYLAMTSFQQVKQPLKRQFYDLENRYNIEEKEQDPYRRLHMQSNTLDLMKRVKEQMRHSLTISTPKPYRNRAQALYDTLENNIKFNERGEIYSDDGSLIDNSRLEDLIQHAVRDRRRNLTPTGWRNFLEILSSHNVPKSMLNRYTLDEMEKGNKSSSKVAPLTVKSEPSSVTQNVGATAAVKPRTQAKRKRKPEPDAFEKVFLKREKSEKNLSFLKTFKK